MKRNLQRAIMLIVAVVLLGAGSRLMAIQPYHPTLLNTGGLLGGKAFGYSTDDGATFPIHSAVCGVVNDGVRNHPALWHERNGVWNLLRLSEPAGGGGSANAVTIFGSGAQRRIVVAGYMDDPTRDGYAAALWIVNPGTGNQTVRLLDLPGSEARGLVSFSADAYLNEMGVVGTRHSGDTDTAMLWRVNLATGDVMAMALPDEGAGAEADTIARLPNGNFAVGGCVDPPSGNEVGAVWEGNPTAGFTFRKLPVDDGPNHHYGMSPTANYAVGVQFPTDTLKWPAAWSRNSSGEWPVIELNNLSNWNVGISASLNAVNSRGRAGGYAGGYGDGLTRGFLLDVSVPITWQRAFMVNDLIPPDERDGTAFTHVAAIGEDKVICGWAEMPDRPGVPQPFVGVPDRRVNLSDVIYGPTGDYGGMSREVASFWLDEGLIPGSVMAGSNTASLRGTMQLDVSDPMNADLAVRVVSHLEGNHQQRVDQALYFYNYVTRSYDLIGMDSLRGGKLNQSNRYQFSGDLTPYLSASKDFWIQLRWIDSGGQFTNTGFTCQLNLLNVIVR